MKLFKKKELEVKEIEPLIFRFDTFDRFILERINYVNCVLCNYDRYLYAPSKDQLYTELKDLIKLYNDFLDKKLSDISNDLDIPIRGYIVPNAIKENIKLDPINNIKDYQKKSEELCPMCVHDTGRFNLTCLACSDFSNFKRKED